MILEVVYRWEDGREEVRYRRPKGTPGEKRLKREVRRLMKRHGDECRYSFRYVSDEVGNSDN